MTTPTTPPPSDAALDVAAVAAEARAYLDGVCVCPEYAAWSPGCARLDCPRHGENAPRLDTLARHLVALAARVTAAEAAHAALAGAVREYLRREADASIARETVEMIDEDATFGDDEESAELTDALREMGETGAALRVARKGLLDALLTAPAPAVVRADVVRAYLDAEQRWRDGSGEYLPGEDVTAYVTRRDAERVRVGELHKAMVAALAAVKETR